MKDKPNVAVFVQARMESTRLPGKVLRKVLGQELLLHEVSRIRRANTVDEVVVISTTDRVDDPIVRLCEQHAIPSFRGSPDDLLDRHYRAALEYNADFVVKIPSDQPLSDPAIVDEVIGLWIDHRDDYDYVSNYHPPTFPDGLDVEGSPIATVERAWREAAEPHEREHTFPYIWDRPSEFRIGNVSNKHGNMFLSHRWTLDYQEDFEFIKAVFEAFEHRPHFSMKDVLSLLADRPQLADINRRYNGVNWYRNTNTKLSTISRTDYKRETAVSFASSLEMLDRSRKVIPCATQTLSKGYTQWSVGAAPLFIERGAGCEVTDIDGNTYIDYGMALGPFILGYCDPDVDSAVRDQLQKGTMFTLPHPLEVAAAEAIVRHVPCAEMVRFGKNGSDATTAATKIARHHTKRDKIIVCGYHGWHDWYIATTERDAGIPQALGGLSVSHQYNDLQQLHRLMREHRGQIAAIIMEPVYVDPPVDGYLEGVRELAAQHGAVLIFDEMFTGFRWGLGGAQGHFGVTPDMACFGKAIANGHPVSCVTGRADLMELFEEVFFSFSYGGETLSLAAIVATIEKLEREQVHKHVWELGAYLKAGIEDLIRSRGLGAYVAISGYPVKTAFMFKGVESTSPLEMKTYVQQECAQRGVLFIGYHLPSFSHTKRHIDFTLDVYDEVFGLLKEKVESGSLRKAIKGDVVTQIFRNVGDRSTGIGAAMEEKVD